MYRCIDRSPCCSCSHDYHNYHTPTNWCTSPAQRESSDKTQLKKNTSTIAALCAPARSSFLHQVAAKWRCKLSSTDPRKSLKLLKSPMQSCLHGVVSHATATTSQQPTREQPLWCSTTEQRRGLRWTFTTFIKLMYRHYCHFID